MGNEIRLLNAEQELEILQEALKLFEKEIEYYICNSISAALLKLEYIADSYYWGNSDTDIALEFFTDLISYKPKDVDVYSRHGWFSQNTYEYRKAVILDMIRRREYELGSITLGDYSKYQDNCTILRGGA